VVTYAPGDSILIVDSVFAFRPECNAFWNYRIWLDVSSKLSLVRNIKRDSPNEGLDGATKLHRDRYRLGEEIYVADVDPVAMANLVVDNSDFANPVVLRSRMG
jgi:uridine kinase